MSCDVQEDAVKVAIFFHEVEDVFEHFCADASGTVRGQTTESHDVQATLAVDDVDSTANCSDDDVVVVSWNKNEHKHDSLHHTSSTHFFSWNKYRKFHFFV